MRVLTTLVVLAQLVLAQIVSDEIVYSSVVVSRTGRRTPILNSTRDATTLTNVGAWQSYLAGSQIRDRYAQPNSTLSELSRIVLDPLQVFALTLANGDFNMQSAQAFMQGLFPAVEITDETAPDLDPTNILADGSYISSPLRGSQYVAVQTTSSSDVDNIYLDSAESCPNWLSFYGNFLNNLEVPAETQALYPRVGMVLGDSVVPTVAYRKDMAYTIYDYLNYNFQYNQTFNEALSTGELAELRAYDRLRYASDAASYAAYADVKSDNPVATMAGKGLATLVLELLSNNKGSSGELNKLNLLFADFQPLLSFFALARMPESSGVNFTGLPQVGSYAIFELYSPSNGTTKYDTTSPLDGEPLSYPISSDLYVRFLFTNNTEEGPAREYPIYVPGGTGSSSEFVLTWQEFETAMSSITFAGAAEWCRMCNAYQTSAFCLAYNTEAWEAYLGVTDGNPFTGSSGLHPGVAGLVGALVTLAIVAIVGALAFFLGGLGFARRKEPVWSSNKRNSGGFKGGQKMASDADLTIVKGGAGVAEKERVGSWELKPGNDTSIDGVAGHGHAPPQFRESNDLARSTTAHQRSSSAISSVRASFDGEDPAVNPFSDPVKPRESV